MQITWQEVCSQDFIGGRLFGEGMGLVFEGSVASLEVRNGAVNKVCITVGNSRRKFKVGGQWKPCNLSVEFELTVPVSRNGGPEVSFVHDGCTYTLSPRSTHRP